MSFLFLASPTPHIASLHVQLVGNLFIRQIQSHEIQAQYPNFQRLRMARKNSVCQIIKTFVTVGTLIALTCGFRVIKAALDDLCGLTRWALDAVWPSQLAHCPITLNIIDQLLDVDLQRWTPSGVGKWDIVSLQHPQIYDPGIQHERR